MMALCEGLVFMARWHYTVSAAAHKFAVHSQKIQIVFWLEEILHGNVG